jgi:hypothetical protein
MRASAFALPLLRRTPSEPRGRGAVPGGAGMSDRRYDQIPVMWEMTSGEIVQAFQVGDHFVIAERTVKRRGPLGYDVTLLLKRADSAAPGEPAMSVATERAPTFRARVVAWRDEGGIVLDDLTPFGAEYPAVGEVVTLSRHEHARLLPAEPVMSVAMSDADEGPA